MQNSKYEYNALCDVCGFKMKASKLRKRWDGYMVCDKDWEPRNILDFYKTRNDAHLLPFTRPDDTGEGTWTILSFTNFSGVGTVTTQYIHDAFNKVLTFMVKLDPSSTTSPLITITGPATFSPLPIGHAYFALRGLTVIGSKTGTRYPITGGFTPLNTITLSGGVVRCPESIIIRGSLTTD